MSAIDSNPDALGTRVLDALSPTKPIYAVLDGARDPRVRGWVFDTRAPAWCLWRGRLPEAAQDVAPYLLRLDHAAAERFFRAAWQNAWGILLASDASVRELRRHLRRFLRVRTEEGKVLLFRYYDPRVLRVFLPSLAAADAADFFGPVEAFAAEADEPGAFHVFRRSAGAVESRAFEPAPELARPAPELARPAPEPGRLA
jgi:hypothetical protein